MSPEKRAAVLLRFLRELPPHTDEAYLGTIEDAFRAVAEERDAEWRAALQKAGISLDAEGYLGTGYARDYATLRKLVRGEM